MRVLLSLLVFVYDFVTFPVYFTIQCFKRKISRPCPVKLRKTVDTEDSIGYTQDVLPSNKLYAEIIKEAKVNTVHKAWKFAVEKYQKKQCFATRQVLGEEDEKQDNGKVFKKLTLGEYQWTTYNQAWKMSQNFGLGLRKLGVQSRDKIAIYAETRQEWILSALGAFSQNITVCTLYTNLGLSAVTHGINETEVSLVIVSHDLLENTRKILPDCPRIRNVVFFKDPLFKTDTHSKPDDVAFTSFESVLDLGEGEPVEENVEPGPDDTAIVMYTSGSTGVPKGVVISHQNIISTSVGIYHLVEFNSSDLYLAYLPLAHILEMLSECTVLVQGVPIAFSSPHTLTDKSTKIKQGEKGDASLIRPTLMCAVPLMLDRIYKLISDAVMKKGKLFHKIFKFAVQYKQYWKSEGFDTPILNALLINKLKLLMGGRIRLILSGGAPLSPTTHEFVRTCLDTVILQGYSMTETACSGTSTEMHTNRTGTVGKPLAGVEIRLEDWDEGNYRVADKPNPRGEILITGKALTKGYFKNEEKTKEDYFEEEGVRFFRTGDIGEFLEDGTLKIIDRKKDLVKLQFGEYVSLGKVESQLKTHPIVENMCLYADAKKTFTVAIISPDRPNLENLAKSLNVESREFTDICFNSKVIESLTKSLAEIGKKTGLHKFEIPAKIHICCEQWLPDSGLVTAAFKIRRKQIQMKFQTQIDAMYS